MDTAILSNITEFDGPLAKALREQANALLQPLAQQHGLTILEQGARYTPTTLTLTIQLIVSTTPNGRSGEQAEFEKYCVIAGLRPDQFGAQFTYAGETYQIVGIAPKRPKRPIIAARTKDGKRFVFTEETVHRSKVVNVRIERHISTTVQPTQRLERRGG